MIWIRRILTIPFIIIFFTCFTAVVFVNQVNDTVFNEDFYKGQLKKGDVYNFVYDDVVPQALDEINKDKTSNFPIDFSNDEVKNEIVSTARKTLPPEWIEGQVESAIDIILPYILGETDEFRYTFIATDRVYIAGQVIKEDLLKSDAFSSVYSDVISYLSDELIETFNELPFDPELNAEDIENSLKEIAPEAWVSSQIASALDAIIPFITEDSNHFAIIIPIEDRVDTIAAAVIELFDNENTYNYLIDEMVTPMITQNLNQTETLPFNVNITRAEISSALTASIPQWWLREQLEALVNKIATYAKGETNTIVVTINVTDIKSDTTDTLAVLADQKLKTLFYSLPTCSMTQFLQKASSLQPGHIPDCRPENMSYDDFKTALNLNIPSLIEQEIIDEIPNQWIYTDQELRSSLGENANFLDDARTYVSNGWTYTDEDLFEQLDNDDEKDLNEIRDWIGNGYTVTEDDLGEIDTESVNDARHTLNLVRTWLWGLWILPLLTLISIAFLGGRSWWGRAAWALSILFFVSLIIFVAINPLYGNFGEPQINNLVEDPAQYEGIQATLIEKGNEMIHNAIDTFISGIARKALYFMIVSGLLLLGIFTWTVIRPWYQTRSSLKEPGGNYST